MNPAATTHHAWLKGRRHCSRAGALTAFAMFTLGIWSTPSQAQEPHQLEPADEAPVLSSQAPLEEERQPWPRWIPEIHGFVSQGFLLTSRNNFLAPSERGSFEFTEVGLNVTEKLTDRFRIGMQLFMRDLGPVGNYKPQFDWFYLDYKFFDWLGLRAGRTKIPFGLYNESNDIDSARVPILLPQAVYPVQSRDYLLAQTGFEVYGRTPYSRAGSIEYRAYGGTIFLDASDSPGVENFEVPYVAGARVMWETPWDGFRLGATYQKVRLDTDAIFSDAELNALKAQGTVPQDAPNRFKLRLPVHLWTASVEYNAHKLLLALEYGRWHAKLQSDVPVLLPPVHEERMYAMASYQVAPWFTPGAYYSLHFTDVRERTGAHNQQHDVALSLRFDPIEHWLFKLEGHFLSGTAYLRDGVANPGKTPDQLAQHWLLFLAKTTAYF